MLCRYREGSGWKMFDFLLPTYVVARWSDYNQDYLFLCTFNSHFVTNLSAADKFYLKSGARQALRRLTNYMYCSRVAFHHEDYEVVDYRELGYSHEDAK